METNAKDIDKGHYADGTVAGQYGDVKDTKWQTLEFHVEIVKGQPGETIENVTTVEGSNIEELGELEEISVNPSETEKTETPSDAEISNGMKLRKIATDILNYALASLVAIAVGMFALREG